MRCCTGGQGGGEVDGFGGQGRRRCWAWPGEPCRADKGLRGVQRQGTGAVVPWLALAQHPIVNRVTEGARLQFTNATPCKPLACMHCLTLLPASCTQTPPTACCCRATRAGAQPGRMCAWTGKQWGARPCERRAKAMVVQRMRLRPPGGQARCKPPLDAPFLPNRAGCVCIFCGARGTHPTVAHSRVLPWFRAQGCVRPRHTYSSSITWPPPPPAIHLRTACSSRDASLVLQRCEKVPLRACSRRRECACAWWCPWPWPAAGAGVAAASSNSATATRAADAMLLGVAAAGAGRAWLGRGRWQVLKAGRARLVERRGRARARCDGQCTPTIILGVLVLG